MASSLKDLLKVTDKWLMPFGKYKGHAVAYVPASYLLWWYDQDPENYPELKDYIKENMKHLREEADLDDMRYGGAGIEDGYSWYDKD